MTYEEAVDAVVTYEEAQLEVHAHSASWAEFVAEYGIHASYSGAVVLAWLGY